MAKVRCQRIGCDAMFSPDDNPDSCCCYHPGPPLFHDGGKEWSCCKKRSHDFSEFLSIPGCTYGKHSSEKPQTKAAPSPNKPMSAPSPGLDTVRTSCQRCRQGFFCADHGPNAIVAPKPKPVSTVSSAEQKAKIIPTEQMVAPSVPKMIDMDAKQVCKHKGCGKVFTERQNNDTACHYHPGPAIFHDRSRGWACCDVHVKEFDEFLEIPPCTYGWHDSCEDK